MKSCFASIVLSATIVSGVGATVVSGVSFGPNECATLTRSAEGSCVISTACEVDDISQTEFAFNCAVGTGVMRHSFGVGNFDTNEEFDTDVKCDKCDLASPLPGSTEAAAKPLALKENPLTQDQVWDRIKVVKENKVPKSKVSMLAGDNDKTPAEKAAEKEAAPAEKTKSTAGQAPAAAKPAAAQEEAAAPAPAAVQAAPPASAEEDTKDEDEDAEDAKEKRSMEEVVHEVKKAKGHTDRAEKSAVSAVTAAVLGFGSLPWNQQTGAVSYGPGGCVSVHKNKEHCIIQTACENEDMSNYEYGFVCVAKGGHPTRHLFGEDSFDKEETFDTLVKCKQCLGLEVLPDSVNLAGEVGMMMKDVKNLQEVMKNISVNVEMLTEKVMPEGASPSSAPAPAAAASPAAFLSHRHHNVRKHHHHSKKHHHVREY